MVRPVGITSDNPAQQARLDELDRSAQSWHSDVAEREIALMGKPETREQARAIEAGGAGKAAMDSIRAKATEIKKAERDLLVTRPTMQPALVLQESRMDVRFPQMP
jgi:methyl-accepting chemotaxis protein